MNPPPTPTLREHRRIWWRGIREHPSTSLLAYLEQQPNAEQLIQEYHEALAKQTPALLSYLSRLRGDSARL